MQIDTCTNEQTTIMTWFTSKEEKAALAVKYNNNNSDDDDDDERSTNSQTPPTSFTRNDILLCATGGKIYAVHKHTGVRLWRAEFPSGSKSRFSVGSMGGIVSVFITDQDRVIVGASGKAACLDLLTGDVKWVNKMKGFGYEEVGSICTPSHVLKPQPSAAEPTTCEEEEEAPPGYHDKDENTLTERPVVVLCTAGKCMGVDIESGEELWRFNCPKGGYRIPVALVDPEGGSATIYVGCGTMLYCMDAITGDLKWETKITNAKMTLGYMTLATPWSSRLSAESHTAFSQFPLAQTEAQNRSNNAASGS
ncbi:hypothetical protein BDA99DRAFT_360556 [Phascolomyces articulosus]|uniref:Pyrrolo-quinoline quinone repeat domain-containing protein n=1 Tax=Phascolomyces articulosus TaxID=60185 RepID=A0AAD5KDE5_9FUNG|nr:hypothetical protein BDA99DRAFT_360556 [Phascolomyces articulosus]